MASQGIPFVSGLVLLLITGFFSGSSLADEKPEATSFDSRPSVACKNVTPADFAKKNDQQHVVEATLKISANLRVKEDQLDTLRYEIRLPDSLEVADFLPKTEVDTEVAGPIETTSATKDQRGVQVSVEGTASVHYLAVASGSVSGKAAGEASQSTASGVEMKLLPPKKVVLAAGTEERGKVLYYKLHPYNQITLEGEKQFGFLLVVPNDWKGNCVELRCVATRKDGSSRTNEMKVGLYPDSDLKAKGTSRPRPSSMG